MTKSEGVRRNKGKDNGGKEERRRRRRRKRRRKKRDFGEGYTIANI